MLYEQFEHIRAQLKFSFNLAAQSIYLSHSLANIFNMKSGGQPSSSLQTARLLETLLEGPPTPTFDLKQTTINGQTIPVTEEILVSKPFGDLIHFKCETGNVVRNVPKVLIVAPISGHKSTILRDTVRELLPDSDVHIIDWKDAREVPIQEGQFDLAKYMDYVQDFIHKIGPDVHIIGISQSTVPVLAVTSLLAARNDPCQPLSMTLMCGPIDPRINETEISRLTRQRDINWFQQNMISRVPGKYPGRGRDVFPGFVQALGMMAAAPGQKQQTSLEMLRKVYGEQGEKLDAHAPYYLDTIEQVFLEHRLPRGAMTWRNEKIDPAEIRNTALFTIEGTHDNITAPGQTLITHKLCKHIPPDLKHHKLQSGAGHYDLFSGPHWKHEISNEIKGFFRKIAATRGIAYDPPQVDTSVTAFQKPPVKQYLAA